MEIRVLRYFFEAAKEKNMTKAASNLHVSQPTLSRQLKLLEEELGQKLFIRSNYSIHLTDEGKILYKRCEDILSMVDKTQSEFKTMKELDGGNIYIGCAESQGISYVAKAAKELQTQYPKMQFHLYSGNADTTLERLDKGLLDFAIIVQELDISKYSHQEIPFKDMWGIIMKKDSPYAKKESIQLEELIDLPLIISRQGVTNEMPAWFKKNKEKLNIVATYDLLYNASLLVNEGIGYALAFDKLVNININSELCFRPISPIITSPMYIVWNPHQILSKPAELYLQKLKSIIS